MGKLRALKGFTVEGASDPYGFTSPLDSYGVATTGELITWDAAMAVGVVFRCVSLLGGTVAGMPLVTYRTEGKSSERAEDRPEYEILKDWPMDDMTSFIWRQTGMAHALLRGNWYSEIIRDRYLGLKGLKLLPPDRVSPYIENGKKLYRYYQPDGSSVVLTTKEMLHIPGLGYDGVQGYSVLSLMRDDVALYRAAHSYGSNFFRNNARPAVVLQHPKTLPEKVQERLAAQMDRLRGSANAGKTIVLEDDMKFQTLGIPPEDAQYMDTRRFQVGELSRWFGVPPHMVGDVTGSTSWGAGIAEQKQGFLTFSVGPWLDMIEQQLKLQLFRGLPELHAEFIRESLMRGDTISQFQAYRLAAGDAPWMTRNEVRAFQNMNPIEGLDEIVLPQNQAPVGPEPEEAEPPEEELEEEEAPVDLAAGKEYNPRQPRVPAGSPQGGEWTSNASTSTAAGKIAEELADGAQPLVSMDEVGAVLDACADRDDNPDLTELRVEGTLLFGGEGLGIARDDMPQIPAEYREDFLAELQASGVQVNRGVIDPRWLKPVQKEVSARVSGQILKRFRREPMDPIKNASIVSSDDYVIDGHHGWGAAVALAFERPNVKMHVLRVELPHGELLRAAEAFAKAHRIANRPIGKYSPDQPRAPRGSDRGGEWTTTGGGGMSYSGLAKASIEGGFTASKHGDAPTTGCMVSPYPKAERIYDADSFSAEDVHRYRDAHRALLAKPGHYLGGWRDGDKIYLDISIHAATRAEARALARRHRQLAYYDLDSGETIPTEEAA